MSETPFPSLSRPFFLLAGIAALLLPVAAPPAAQPVAEPWLEAPFTADPTAVMAAAERLTMPTDGPIVVLLRDTTYAFDEASRITYRQRLVYRILTVDGLEAWSTTEVSWAPWHQDRPEMRARVIAPGGREYRLDAATLSESPAPSPAPDLYADQRILEAPLPAVTVGAVVEEEVVVRDREPLFAAGVAAIHHLQMFAPVRRSRLVLAAPITLPLRYGVRLRPDLTPRREVRDGRVELVFEVLDLFPISAVEPGLPSHQARLPHVAFSTGDGWQQVAARYSEIVDEKIGDGEVASLLGWQPGGGADTERLSQLLARLHDEVRYTGLELGAASIIPATPRATLERKYGDCKDQATLLTALLREEGIPAYVALLLAGFGKDVDTQLPGLGRFNHAIVYVPATPPIWIDPTDPTAHAGELPAADQGRWALIASPNTESLIRTPIARSADNLTVETRRVELAPYGPARIVESTVYRGEPERQQREITLANDEGSRRDAYRSYVEASYLAAALGDVEEGDAEDMSEPFTLSLEALKCGRAVTDLTEAVVAIRFEDLVSSLPPAIVSGSGLRQNDYVVNQPFVNEWRYEITPPTGFVPRSLPEDLQRELGPARLSHAYRLADGVLHATFRFDSGPRRLTAEQFRELRRGVQELLAAEPVLLWFDHQGAAALAAGRSREAIDLYRGFAEREPAEALHRVRWSQALLTVGLGLEAQHQARRATELAPRSATTFWSLGLALEHDELGRRFADGFERASAIAALERAVELEPGHDLARTELAILYEHDAAGKRYSPAADLERAIDEYRRLRADSDRAAIDANLLAALFWAERWDELLQATAEVGESDARKFLRLVALAILEGPEAAIRESGNLSSTQEDQIGLLGAAAQRLLIVRRYPEAAALLRRAARGAANPTAVLTRAELIGRAGRYEQIPVSAADPTALARSFMVLLSREEVDQELLARVFHPDVLAAEELAENGLQAAFDEMRQAQLRISGDLPLEVVLDLAFAALATSVEGDDERGYRVRLANDAGGGATAFRIYLVPYGGEYRIVAISGDFAEMAREALRRLERGDLAGARQWLDWAREVIADRDSEDPYGFVPFARFWTRGEEAEAERVRLAAALLMVNRAAAAEAVPVLRAALAQSADQATRRIIQVALVLAYGRTEDDAALAALGAELLAAEPSSALAFHARCALLVAEEDWAQLERISKERLAARPDDPEALRYLARIASWQRRPEQAAEYFQRLRDRDAIEANDYNQWAWMLLFGDAVPEEALRLAQRGATLSNYRRRPILHTLASLFAELGRPAEAYQAIVQSLELKEPPVPDGDDWYVFGRIAEDYGFTDLAREYYRRVKASADDEPYATFELARKRLKGLPKADQRRQGLAQ